MAAGLVDWLGLVNPMPLQRLDLVLRPLPCTLKQKIVSQLNKGITSSEEETLVLYPKFKERTNGIHSIRR